MHRMQTMCAYNAPKPEQKIVQVKDSSTKPSYRQKPLQQLPKREGKSHEHYMLQMWTSGSHLDQLSLPHKNEDRADDTEDLELDPLEEDLPPDKEGEGENSEHQEEQLDIHMEPQYQWDTEEEEETDDNAVSYRTNAIRIALDTAKQAITKIMAAQTNAMVLSKTVEPIYSHRSRHREQPIRPRSDNRTLVGYWEIDGVKAHCLVDSRSEGVLLFPEFTQAMGIKTFALEQPIALQLACISS